MAKQVEEKVLTREEEKAMQKEAKKSWLAGMRLLYPNFKKRMWASDAYRIAHPQPM